MGLYHDDCLEIFQNISKPETGKKKKAMLEVLSGYSLSITI